jgi:acyl-CoA synthetase (AMP-forming)/AMP-acid ligase II
VSVPPSVCALIEQACARHASRTALTELVERHGRLVEDRSVTYGRLHDLSLRLIAGLRRRGLRPGDRLCVLLDNCIEMVITEWACLLTGMVWVALNARSSQSEIAEILRDCRPSMVISDARHAPLLEGRPAQCELVLVGERAWDELIAEWPGAAESAAPPDAEATVRIRYTSGTAGRPKGAMLPRRAYDASVETVSAVIAPLTGEDVLLQVAPMTHAAGAMLLPHLQAGARALLAGRFDASAFVDACERYRATAVFLVPTMLVRILDAVRDTRRLDTLRTVVYGGASMPAERLAEGVERLGAIFVQIYGLTESTWPVTALLREDHVRLEGESREDWLRRLRSCGRPTSVGELRVVGADGVDVAVGEVGEIRVRGRNTMSGYWHAERAAAADAKGLDAAGWMHTGDLATVDSRGYVTIVDRLHDMIVSGGFNVYPREVEEALLTHPAVLECAVVGRPDAQWGEAVWAFVVLRAGATVEPAELIEHCTRRVARYKKPHGVEIVEALPKNAAGKIVRRALRDRLGASR